MNSRSLFRPALIFAIGAAACTAGPERPESVDYQPLPVVDIHARVVDPPAGPVGAVRMKAYGIAHRDLPIGTYGAGTASATTIEGELRFRLHTDFPSVSGPNGQLGSLRFFRLVASMYAGYDPAVPSSGGPYVGQWEQPGLLLVYAAQAQTWSTFGPSGQTVTFPQGYSLLRRWCGATAGQIEMEVRPTDDPVELRHQELGVEDDGFEAWERAFVASCGVEPPAMDIGTRASFDIAQALVWSPDASTLYYLSPAEPDDKTETVGLRQVRLADSSATELATVAHGAGVQAGKLGEVFVTTRSALLRFTTTPAVAMVSIPLTNPGSATVSPDGRWLGYSDYPVSITESELPTVRGHVMDLDAGANAADVEGGFAGWSPDGRFAYWSSFSPHTELVITKLGQPAALEGPWPVGTAGAGSLIWTPVSAFLARIPGSWTNRDTQQTYQWSFGLTLLDPGTGVERSVLDASAGMLSLVRTPPVLDSQLVWATKCLGLWSTVCSSALLHVRATMGTVETVATWSTSVPTALSTDGRQVALGTSKGIYVKQLPQ